MDDSRKYYEAYDDRYRQVHKENLQWFAESPSPVVTEMMNQLHIQISDPILEIGCGEGRDAGFLLTRGYNVCATDVSSEAVSFCKARYPEFAGHFQVVDCVNGQLDGEFDFIYAVAVVHMLVPDEDRNSFYRFIREHLTQSGAALICTMGDGEGEMRSDIRTAFDLQQRQHQPTGRTLMLAGTSCRVVSFDTFGKELAANGLAVLKKGMTSVEPDFPQMMYAVVKRVQ